MTTTLRIGMISFAHGHAASYTECLRRIPGIEIVGIWDAEAARGQAEALHFDTIFYSDLERLLSENLDAVIICSENANHRQHVEWAAGKVKAILCEKPIATTVEDAQAMIDICRRTNTKLQVAFPVRFSQSILALKAKVDSGVLGRIISATCTNHGGNPGGWFADRALAGGGAVMDHTVHVIDILRWLWQTEVQDLFAEVGYQKLGAQTPIDDAGLISFSLANGIYGTLDTSWSRPKSYPTWGDVKIEVLGEKGLICVDAFDQHLNVSSNLSGKTKWVGWGSNMDQGLINDFVEMIRTGREPSITGTDGLRALEVALAAYRAAETGKVVKLR